MREDFLRAEIFKRAAIDVTNIPASAGAVPVENFLRPRGSACYETVIMRGSEHSFGRVADAQRNRSTVISSDTKQFRNCRAQSCRIAATDALQRTRFLCQRCITKLRWRV
jgi:hypothetical protein